MEKNMLNPNLHFAQNWKNLKSSDTLFVHIKYPADANFFEILKKQTILHSQHETYLIKIEGEEKIENLKELLLKMESNVNKMKNSEYARAYDFQALVNSGGTVLTLDPDKDVNSWWIQTPNTILMKFRKAQKQSN